MNEKTIEKIFIIGLIILGILLPIIFPLGLVEIAFIILVIVLGIILIHLSPKMIEKVFILSLIVLGILLIHFASQTQMLGEDEPFYYELGKDFSQINFPAFDALGKPMVLWQFVPLSFAIPFIMFGASLNLAKIIITVFGILTLLIVYLIGRKINIWFGIASAFLLFSMTLFAHFMQLLYLEIPIAFFSALVTYMFLSMDSPKKAVAAGAVMALAFYTKQTGLFLVGGLLLYALYLYFFRKDKNYLKLSLIAIAVAILLISPFFIRNIIIYNYPYVFFINFFFKEPAQTVHWEGIDVNKILSNPMLDIQSYASNLGWLVTALMIFGLSYFLLEVKNKKLTKELFLFVILSFIFISLYYAFYLLDMGASEPRNIFIIFPQLALIGGFFIYKLKEYSKYSLPLIVLVIILSAYVGVSIGLSTSISQRYPDNYLQALSWLKNNTAKSDFVLTTYSGSVKYYAERNAVWNINELPQIMSTSNSTYIYGMMKKYNVSYILIWRGVLGSEFIIPASNLIGVFTYNFLNTVAADNTSFMIEYQNADDIIFKVL
jgi:4-amino-4-deoxy-L-arabinose transferase-like glycosyltransferase